MLYVPLSTIDNPLELRSIVSLGTACCTNDRQGSPTRPLPNAWLVVVSDAENRLAAQIVQDSPTQSARRLHTEWGPRMGSPTPSAKD